ncbi:MAG: glycosyltransferase [Bryobacteraceae bacterium]|nr:glycosyltransferase [Bryobacteraceae bacterium]
MTDTFRSVHLTNAWHGTSGGIAAFYRALFQAADDRDHALSLVVPGETGGEERVGRYGSLYSIRADRAPLNGHYRLLGPKHYLWPRSPIRRVLERVRPHLVGICDKYSLPYVGGLLRNRPRSPERPVVVGVSCERMDDNFLAYLGDSAVGRWFCRAYMKWIYFAQCDHHVANSRHTAEELRQAARGHKVRRSVWIQPMGVDLSRLSPHHRDPSLRASVAHRAGGSEASVLLFYAGRLVPEKNLGLLAETLGELRRRGTRDFRLILAGDGSERERFAAQCEAAAPRRTFSLGHITDPQELARLYASLDIFLHPNPREPFGIGPLEAMASGIPVVAPNTGGVTTYLDPSCGWPVPATPAAFAEAVTHVLGDEPSRESRLAEARRVAERYSWNAVAGRYLDLEREIYRAAQESRSSVPPDFHSTPGDFFGRESSTNDLRH